MQTTREMAQAGARRGQFRTAPVRDVQEQLLQLLGDVEEVVHLVVFERVIRAHHLRADTELVAAERWGLR